MHQDKLTGHPTGLPSVVVIGGVLVDDIAIPDENLRQRSSNPVTWERRLGGVAANVASVVAQQLQTTLIASVGDDADGSLLRSHLQSRSVECHFVEQAAMQTDRYTAVLDHNGELYIGLAAARLAEQLTWHDIEPWLPEHSPASTVLDANLSVESLNETVTGLQEKLPATRIVGLAVSPAKAKRWLPVASRLSLFFCNRREAAALAALDANANIDQLADALLGKNFNCFVITDGESPALVQDTNSRTHIEVPSRGIEHNVNGAGDALAGATIARLVQGSSLAEAIASSGMQAANGVLTGNIRSPLL